MTGYLADTHLALWLIDGSDKLPARAKEMMCGEAGPWFHTWLSLAQAKLHTTNFDVRNSSHAEIPHADD